MDGVCGLNEFLVAFFPFEDSDRNVVNKVRAGTPPRYVFTVHISLQITTIS